jgi:DNA-binding MarR family transcriptional regulator
MITTASITSLIDTLEKRGLVTRSVASDDRRKQLVTLTSAGHEAVTDFLPKIVALQTAMTARLTEGEKQQLERLLDVIGETITELDPVSVAEQAPARVPPERPRGTGA